MITDAIEKMAVALYMADYPGAGDPAASDTDAMMYEKYRSHYRDCVRAVLLSVREQDEEFFASMPGMRCGDWYVDGRAATFRDMVDGILKST